AEARLRVALRKARRLEHNAEQREAHTLAAAGAESTGRGAQATPPLAPGRQFLEQVLHVLRQVCETAGGGAVLFEGVVDPEIAQHLDEVRLAAAEEAADPGGGLLRVAH